MLLSTISTQFFWILYMFLWEFVKFDTENGILKIWLLLHNFEACTCNFSLDIFFVCSHKVEQWCSIFIHIQKITMLIFYLVIQGDLDDGNILFVNKLEHIILCDPILGFYMDTKLTVIKIIKQFRVMQYNWQRGLYQGATINCFMV